MLRLIAAERKLIRARFNHFFTTKWYARSRTLVVAHWPVFWWHARGQGQVFSPVEQATAAPRL